MKNPETSVDIEAKLAKRLIAVINTGSGGCDESAGGGMTEIFSQAGLSGAEVVSVPPSGIEAALKRAVALAEVVVVLGGDGTIRSAGARCSKAGKLLIPLPGGTMNMLPHALYGARTWQAILTDTLAAPRFHPVSGGRGGGVVCFGAGVLGGPSLWGYAREALRDAVVVVAVMRAASAIQQSARDPLEYQLGDKLSGKAEAVAVICPLVSRAMQEDEPSLEAAAVEPMAAGGLFRLAFHTVFDDWRSDPSISLAKVTHIQVKGQGRVPAIFDGEKVRLTPTVRVDFIPVAFCAVAPRKPIP